MPQTKGFQMVGWRRRAALVTAAGVCAASGLIVTTSLAKAFADVAATPMWKIQHSPNVTRPGGEIHAISCSSAGACTAVGTNVSKAGLNVTLAERWNGSSWTRQATPSPAAAVTAPAAPVLQGVSCPSATFCETVGTNSLGPIEPQQTVLADVWKGRSWSTQSVPTPAGTTSASLSAVSCKSRSFCVAVGSYVDASGRSALAERWNGSSWHVQSTPVPAGTSDVQFLAVSCINTTSCEAVGSY